MGSSILVIGEQGSGKSRAIINLNPATTCIMRPNKKDLPFRNWTDVYKEGENLFTFSTFGGLYKRLEELNKPDSKFIVCVIEDVTHLFSQKLMADANRRDWEKWSELALAFYSTIIEFARDRMRDSLNLIIIGHTMTTQLNSGRDIVTIQTPGKLLDEKIKIPSYFTYVLHTDVMVDESGTHYRFLTNYDGTRIAKTPEGCFDEYEPNDYKLILEKISKYKSAGKAKKDKE